MMPRKRFITLLKIVYSTRHSFLTFFESVLQKKNLYSKENRKFHYHISSEFFLHYTISVFNCLESL